MIGFIGGTGNQGRALALRLAAAGKEVLLGSRSRKKAEKVVEKIKMEREGLKIRAGTNEEAARKAEIVFVTLPYNSMKATLEPLKKHLKGKIVVDVINPLVNGNIHKGVSASEELQAILTESKVVCAFKNVSSQLMGEIEKKVEVDTIVCSDFDDAKKEVMGLSERMGIRSLDGDGLENAMVAEMLTKLLLQLNKKYKAQTGIRIVTYPI